MLFSVGIIQIGELIRYVPHPSTRRKVIPRPHTQPRRCGGAIPKRLCCLPLECWRHWYR